MMKRFVVFVAVLLCSVFVSAQTQYTINFDTDANGSAIQQGQDIDDEYSSWGVTFSSNLSGHPLEAYDSENPISADLDLGTPNEKHGGKGVGSAGETSNTSHYYNILIIADSPSDPPNTEGDYAGSNGLITADYTHPVTVDQICFIDDLSSADVKFTFSDNSTSTIGVIDPGENGVNKQNFNQSDVKKMEIDFNGSGGIPFIKFTPPDFGDAEAAWGVASQQVDQTRTVRMGESVDSEISQKSSVGAVGDDVDGSNDEDGVTFWEYDGSAWVQKSDMEFIVNTQYQVRVDVNLGSGESATLTGWFDFNVNNVFGDNADEIIINNESIGSSGTYTYTFTIPTGATTGENTYLRFRLDADATSNLSPTGNGGAGEVEDYSASSTPPVAITLSALNATLIEKGILVSWNVQTELNHAGYNVYRSTSRDGEYEQLNASLINSDVLTDVATAKTYEYLDETALPNQVYYYKLEDVSLNGESTWHGPVSVSMASDVDGQAETVNAYKLVGNYPNPFNPSTTIEYTIANSEYVELNVYSMTGQRVTTLVSTEQPAGRYRISWNAVDDNNRAVPSGTYIYRLTAGDFIQTGKMLLLK